MSLSLLPGKEDRLPVPADVAALPEAEPHDAVEDGSQAEVLALAGDEVPTREDPTPPLALEAAVGPVAARTDAHALRVAQRAGP